MVAYAICRIAKLKTPGAIAGVVGHNGRTRPTANADPAGKVIVLADAGPDPAAAVARRIGQAGARARVDSVLAVEVLLSASPEYFRPGQPEAAGTYDEARMKAWGRAAWDWAKAQWGDRIVDARVHLDEATPHLQLVMVPVEGPRLSADHFFGNRQKLRDLQTSYGKAVAPLGIQRGVEGSLATHTSVKEYYAEVNAPAPKEPSPVRKRKVDVPPPMVRESVRIAWADGQNIAAKSVLGQERSRYTSEIKPHLNRSKAVDRLKKEAAAAKSTAAAANARADEAENAARKAQERAEAAQARDIPLERVMALYGLEIGENGRFEGEGRSIRIDGSKWFDDGSTKPASGRGAIDLVKHLRGLDFKDSVAWLKSNFDQKMTVDAIIVDTKVKAIDLVSNIDQPKPFVPPEPVPDHWPRVRRWLTSVRRLAVDLVDWLHGLGRIYADEKANAVFIMTDQRGRPVGAELKGTGSTPFTGMAAGTSRNAGAFTIPPLGGGSASAVVLVESAIDAMSYIQIHSSSSGIEVKSTGGIRSQIPWAPDRGDVVVAFDADSVGDKAAAALLAGLPPAVRGRRDRPAGGKDWNDLVKSGSGLPPSSDDLDIDRPRPLAAPVPAPRRQSDDPEPNPS